MLRSARHTVIATALPLAAIAVACETGADDSEPPLIFLDASAEVGGGGNIEAAASDNAAPPEPSCGELARANAWAKPLCEHAGNGACAGMGPSTRDCNHCCNEAPDSAASERCCMALPTTGTSRGFDGCGAGGSHFGIDYPLSVGTPVLAEMSGTVVFAQVGFPNCWNTGSCGALPCSCACLNTDFNTLKIRADCGDPREPTRDFYVYYSHIDRLAAGIVVGSHVRQGELIAYGGDSGCSSGPHLHLESVSVPKGASAFLATCDAVDAITRACQ